MNKPAPQQLPRLQTELDDLLGSLTYARRSGDLGRLALLTYWDVRRWARVARRQALAEHTARIISDHPHASREDFLRLVDDVIAQLQTIRGEMH